MDTNLGQGVLVDDYGGATASAAAVGAGAKVLIRSFKHPIAPQPVSIEGQNGHNAAVRVTQLTLTL